MIEREQALTLAANCLKKKASAKRYSFSSCDFVPEHTGRYPTPSQWIVRYRKFPSEDGSVTDDGDELFVVKIQAESGEVSVLQGF